MYILPVKPQEPNWYEEKLSEILSLFSSIAIQSISQSHKYDKLA